MNCLTSGCPERLACLTWEGTMINGKSSVAPKNGKRAKKTKDSDESKDDDAVPSNLVAPCILLCEHEISFHDEEVQELIEEELSIFPKW
jgi:hypothetical protein